MYYLRMYKLIINYIIQQIFIYKIIISSYHFIIPSINLHRTQIVIEIVSIYSQYRI